jgi:hypothetical protein
MQTSTSDAFRLLEGWKKEAKSLHVVAALKGGISVGGRFTAVVRSAYKNDERVILLADTLNGPVEVSLDLSGCLFEYFEPGVAVGPGIENWLCFLQARLFDGGMVMFLVPR